MKRGRRPVMLAIMMVLVGMVFVLPAAPALAATCSGFQCDGKNPHTTSCDANADTFETVYIRNAAGTAIGTVEYRWSLICLTSWSRVTSWIGAQTLTESIERDDPSTPGHTTIYEKTYSDTDYGATQAFSPMVYYLEGLRTRACGGIGSYGKCTSWWN